VGLAKTRAGRVRAALFPETYPNEELAQKVLEIYADKNKYE